MESILIMSQRSAKKILVTGGAGFIGSAFIRYLIESTSEVEKIVNFDLLTYAADLKNLSIVEGDSRYTFVRGNVLNGPLVEELIRTHDIDTIVHFAAESHVDRSIDNPHFFYRTNVEGTLTLLEVVRRFPHIHFHHVSTDEVYGSIETGSFTEKSPYQPNSPYAASKAASDHFVRSYHQTYQLSITLSHASNNYGPYQHREKFIPRMIDQCIKKQRLTLYGKGINVRNWIYVEDHVKAIWLIVKEGKKGENYNIGGRHEARNVDLLHQLIERFAKIKEEDPTEYHSLITYIEDRPGHDFRYALNCEKLEAELGWSPEEHFDQGLEKTIKSFLT